MDPSLIMLEELAELETAAVSSLMQPPGELIAPDTTLGEAACALDRLQSSSLLVAADGEMIGIVTLHDLTSAFCGGHGPGEPVRDFMSRDVITVRESDSLGAAARLMSERRIRHLPVLDARGKLVGVLNTRDFRRQSAAAMKSRAEHAKKLEKALEDTLAGTGGGDGTARPVYRRPPEARRHAGGIDRQGTGL